eukprot:365377-Chlamydomonas_euryale.AAC.4
MSDISLACPQMLTLHSLAHQATARLHKVSIFVRAQTGTMQRRKRGSRSVPARDKSHQQHLRWSACAGLFGSASRSPPCATMQSARLMVPARCDDAVGPASRCPRSATR